MVRSPTLERPSPRISANDLAKFMVSSDTARIGIIRRAKAPMTAPIIRYRDVRAVICAFLSDPLRRVNRLADAEDLFRQRAQASAESALRQEDARLSLQVLQALHRMANRLAALDFANAPHEQAKLRLGGVDVSVRADLFVRATHRDQDQFGAAVLRMTVDDAETDDARTKRREMGLYVATLARLHVDQNLVIDGRIPSNRLCMSIDIQHGEAFPAPASSTRRTNDLENACRFISAMWDQV